MFIEFNCKNCGIHIRRCISMSRYERKEYGQYCTKKCFGECERMEQHHNWKQSNPHSIQVLRKIMIRAGIDITKCGRCGGIFTEQNKPDIHHKDKNHHNNDPKNLLIVHRTCHRREDGTGKIVDMAKARGLTTAQLSGRIRREKHKEKINESHRLHYIKNRVKILERSRIHYYKNRKRILQRQKRRRLNGICNEYM